jgi:CheY-like chemotaxis protein
MNGYEIAKRIRQDDHGRRMLLLALSGYDAPADWARSESGFDHHLVKPVDPDQLARLLCSGDANDAGA